MNGENEPIRRRDVLKATGTALGVAGIGALPSKAEASAGGTKIGEVNFAEIFITHKGIPGFPTTNTDDFADYQVFLEKDRLEFTRWAPEEAIEKARNADFLYTNGVDEYKTGKSPKMGGHKSSSARVDPTEKIELEKPYRSPVVRVESQSNGSIHISTESNAFSVEPNEIVELDLAPRKVSGRKHHRTKTIDDPRRDGGVLEVPQPSVEEATIRPQLKMTNYGTKEVLVNQ